MGNKIQPVSSEEYEALVALVCPRSQAELFDYESEKLVSVKLARHKHADPFRKKIPERGLFLLVPPEPNPKELDLDHLMSLIVLDEVRGVNYLDPASLRNLVEVPAGAILLTDIEDGRARLNIEPSVSREKIKSEGRHAYTTWRGIIHGVLFPEVLKHHNMDLVASQFGSDHTPYLYRNDARPKLHNPNWNDHADPRWGAPSSGSVVVA